MSLFSARCQRAVLRMYSFLNQPLELWGHVLVDVKLMIRFSLCKYGLQKFGGKTDNKQWWKVFDTAPLWCFLKRFVRSVAPRCLNTRRYRMCFAQSVPVSKLIPVRGQKVEGTLASVGMGSYGTVAWGWNEKEWMDSIGNFEARVAHHNLRKHDVPHNLLPTENQKPGVEFNVSPCFFLHY